MTPAESLIESAWAHLLNRFADLILDRDERRYCHPSGAACTAVFSIPLHPLSRQCFREGSFDQLGAGDAELFSQGVGAGED